MFSLRVSAPQQALRLPSHRRTSQAQLGTPTPVTPGKLGLCPDCSAVPPCRSSWGQATALDGGAPRGRPGAGQRRARSEQGACFSRPTSIVRILPPHRPEAPSWLTDHRGWRAVTPFPDPWLISPCGPGLHPASGSRTGGEPGRAGRALLPWAPSRQPGRDTWVRHELGALERTGSLGAMWTSASLSLSPEIFRHTSFGTTNPSLGKSKPLASSQPLLGCKSTSGRGSVVCHRLHIGRDGALVTRSLRKGPGAPGWGDVGPRNRRVFHSFRTQSPQSRAHKASGATAMEQDATGSPAKCALRMQTKRFLLVYKSAHSPVLDRKETAWGGVLAPGTVACPPLGDGKDSSVLRRR